MSNKIEIEDYRGWTIFFDKEQDKFHSVSQADDVDKSSKSFTSAKKAIDDYIKDNVNFKPFKVQSYRDYSVDEKFEIATIVGVRKDGRYLIQKDGKDPEQLSGYDEKYWMLLNQANETTIYEICNRVAAFDETRKAHDAMIRQLRQKLTVRTVEQMRKETTKP